MNTLTPNSMPSWTPPHCPNPICPFHNPLRLGWRYRRCGTHARLKPPYSVPRFQCRHCQRTFSPQTFSTTYWLKRPELLTGVFLATANGMANRQIARTFHCAPSTVNHLLARLGRHCLLFQRHFCQNVSPPGDIAIDGLVSFEFSQYYPFEHLVAVDNDTSFIQHFTDAPLRRSGRMTASQKRRRQELESQFGRPDPQAVLKATVELVSQALLGADKAVVRSDQHQAYPRALKRVACEIDHRTTSSRDFRDRHNALFEINALDAFLRHSSANHRRETMAASKRRQGASERLAVFMVWRNFVKRRWENKCEQTPAMLRGIVDRVLTVADVLARRLFVTQIELGERWRDYYWRRVETVVLPVNRRHTLFFAF
jgi:transposase-like protein